MYNECIIVLHILLRSILIVSYDIKLTCTCRLDSLKHQICAQMMVHYEMYLGQCKGTYQLVFFFLQVQVWLFACRLWSMLCTSLFLVSRYHATLF